MFERHDWAQAILVTAACAFMGVAVVAQFSGASWEMAALKGAAGLLAVGGFGWAATRLTATAAGESEPPGADQVAHAPENSAGGERAG